MLLNSDPRVLADENGWAVDRMAKHLDLEGKRRKAGITTDLERWLKGEKIWD